MFRKRWLFQKVLIWVNILRNYKSPLIYLLIIGEAQALYDFVQRLHIELDSNGIIILYKVNQNRCFLIG